MATEAQRRAYRKYKKRMLAEGKIKRFNLEFNESELDLYEHMKGKQPSSAYIKELIRKDMENEG